MALKKILTAFFLSLTSTILLINEIPNKLNASQIKFDFSRENSDATIKVSSKQLIEIITNDSVGTIEADYLINQDATLMYENRIPNNNVTTFLNLDTLYVQANPYSYIDVNGNEICWTPDYINLENTNYYFANNNNVFECTINDVLDESEQIEVIYKTTLNLDKDNLNMVINQAYDVADYYVSNNIIENETQKYQQLYQQYLLDLDAYNKYEADSIKYEQDKILYDNYLLELQDYESKKKLYDEYLVEYNTYLEELEQYNTYLEELQAYETAQNNYQNYLNALKIYDDEYAEYLVEYDKYCGYMVKINYQLSAMELIKTSMTSLNRDVYSSVMGDAVTQVLKNVDLLVEAGAPAAVVEDANEATIQLKKYFPEYFSLTSNKEKYSYYKTNYRNILKNIELLLRSLDRLYRVPLVKNALEKGGMFEDYKDKFVILISQLALVANALDKNPVATYEGNLGSTDSSVTLYFDDTWRINGKSMQQALEYDYNFVDVNEYAGYLPIDYPDMPVKPTKPEVVSSPTKPNEVTKPIEPESVSNPGQAPETVNDPIEPTKVDKPTEPVAYVVDEQVLKLIEAYKEGTLHYRTPLNNDYALQLTSTLTKKFKNQDIVVVEFYDLESNFIDSYQTDLGSYIVYDSKMPTKSPDNVYASYAFLHWQYEDGSILDLSNVTKEGRVYPVFVGDKLQKYQVSFTVNGDVTTLEYEYGAMPSYDGDLSNFIVENKYFNFVSWDKEFETVTKDASYVAIFDENYLISDGTNHANIKYDGLNITVDLSMFDNTNVYLGNFIDEVLKKNQPYDLKFLTNNGDITISLTALQTTSLIDSDFSYIEIIAENVAKNEYVYQVNFYNSNNVNVNVECNLSAVFDGKFNKGKSNLYVVNDDETHSEVRADISNYKLSAKIQANKKYMIYPLYTVNCLGNNEYVEIVFSNNKYKAGDNVSYQINIKQDGIEISNIIFMSSTSFIEPVDNSFVMPEGDVSVHFEYKFINYVVEFYSDGELISTKTYKYGEKINPPANPFKADDENYSYTFAGWDKEFDTVTQDIKINAIFEKAEIIPVEFPEPSKFNIVKFIKITLFSSIGITIALIAFLIVKKKFLKK